MKRFLDVTCSAVALVVLSPVMLAVAVAIRVAMGRPVLYRQLRIGLSEQPFSVIKFRTMRTPLSQENEFFSDEDRVTPLGQFLRSSSLDELPELWLVLRGKMSLVGPRPLLPIYLELYRDHHRQRHEVRPGLTGLAQVSGRQDLTLSQRLDLDVQYVQQRSLWLDLRILVRTFRLVFTREGVRTGQSFEDVDDIGLAEALQRSSGDAPA